MKLVKCTPYVTRNPEPDIGGALFTFLKLETDEGIVGWGETELQHTFYQCPKVYPQLVSDVFDFFLKGEDALDRERLKRKMYNKFSCFHPDMFTGSIISAFDMALWDIAGKVANLPVYQLLGGKYRDKIRAYTYIYPDPGDNEFLWDSWINPDHVLRNSEKYLEAGWTALKYDPLRQGDPSGLPASPWELSLKEYRTAERSLDQMRRRFGDEVDILVGTHGQLTTASAIKFGTMLEDYDVMWFEEPVLPENTKEMAKVARAVKVPVATGERLVGIHEFQRLFEDEGCAIAQPDLGTVGGITEAKKIAAMAEAKYIQMATHVWGGPILLASALHVDTAIPNFLIQETIGGMSDFMRELVDEPIVWKDGYLYVSERPGLGMNLNEKQLEKYSAV